MRIPGEPSENPLVDSTTIPDATWHRNVLGKTQQGQLPVDRPLRLFEMRPDLRTKSRTSIGSENVHWISPRKDAIDSAQLTGHLALAEGTLEPAIRWLGHGKTIDLATIGERVAVPEDIA